jgi:hypothetical protein
VGVCCTVTRITNVHENPFAAKNRFLKRLKVVYTIQNRYVKPSFAIIEEKAHGERIGVRKGRADSPFLALKYLNLIAAAIIADMRNVLRVSGD